MNTKDPSPLGLVLGALIVVALLLFVLSGCSLTPTMPDVIKVPVGVSCLKEVPERPRFRTARELNELDDYKLVIGLYEDRLSRMQYERLLEAAIEACKDTKR